MKQRKFKTISKLCKCCVIALISIGIIVGIVMDRRKNQPIILGFSAQLTGRQAELGVQERNGVQLALEQFNETGGIEGRIISLAIHDDLGNQEEAKAGDEKLIEKGAVAIIGHVTTSQTLAGLEVANNAKVVMVGPTVSTPKLSGIDDYFIRIHPSFEKSSQSFAQYIFEHKGIKNIAIIFDKDNLAYSKTYSTIFSDSYQSLGGNVKSVLDFSSNSKPDFSNLIEELQETKADGLLIVASDIDTALIAQRLRLMNWEIPLFASSWAQTETLISNGGQAVEGMILEQAYDLNNQSSEFQDFKSRYCARFGNEPSFGAAFSYESTLMVIEGLKKTHGSKIGLKEALLEVTNFNGLTEKLKLNKFGDVERNSYLNSISNGKFVRIDKSSLTNTGGE